MRTLKFNKTNVNVINYTCAFPFTACCEKKAPLCVGTPFVSFPVRPHCISLVDRAHYKKA